MTWPLEIISAAEYSVKLLSGMVPLQEEMIQRMSL
jgi:hypothetical protein